MSEIHIQSPCADCPLIGTGEDILNIYDKYLLPMAKDGLERALGCKHPWRVANTRFKGEPNEPQVDVLVRLVRLRGKSPENYGLVDRSTEQESGDIEMTNIEEIAVKIMGVLDQPNLVDLLDEEILEQIGEIIGEYASREDVKSGFEDRVFQRVSEIQNQRNDDLLRSLQK